VLKLLADENFDNTIIRGLLRRNPNIDIVRVQDVGLSGQDDPNILSWAAQENRVLLTHDVATITKYAYERVANSYSMPGAIEVRTNVSISRIIEDLLLILECIAAEELEGQILYVPL